MPHIRPGLVLVCSVGLFAMIMGAAGPANGGGQAPCTIFASPSGVKGNTGKSSGSPLDIYTASKKTVPGDVVCLMAGTYSVAQPIYINRSGSSSGYIVYRGNYNGEAVLRWTGSTSPSVVLQIAENTSYISIERITLDGGNVVRTIQLQDRSHHIRILRNRIRYSGSAGVSVHTADYVTVDGNHLYRNGNNPATSWGSAISLHQRTWWYDQAAGFHAYVVNNVITGQVDVSSAHSDGNGIISDRGGNSSPALIANNVVYMNGGRCINSYLTNHIWIVNNTCYKNLLDLRVGGGSYVGELMANNATDVHWINNVAYGWTRPPYNIQPDSQVLLSRNVQFGPPSPKVPASVLADPNQLRTADPMFVSPPNVSPTGDRQWQNGPPPWQIGGAFTLKTGSTLINAGIDPRTAPGATSALRAGMAPYVTRDVNGAARPLGSGWDIGAYER